MAIPPLRVLIHSTLVDASNNMLPNLRTYIIWNVRFGSKADLQTKGLLEIGLWVM
jgi:hypothetical protein